MSKRRLLKEILEVLEEIRDDLRRRAVSAKITLGTPVPQTPKEKDMPKAAATNFQLQDSFKVPYQISAVDSKGVPVPATGATAAVTSSDTLMATVVPDATPAAGSIQSGWIIGGSKPGTVTIAAVVTQADGTVLPTVQDLIDVVTGAVSTVSINLGIPVPQ